MSARDDYPPDRLFDERIDQYERMCDEIDRLRAEVTNLREVSFAYVRLQAERGTEAT